MQETGGTGDDLARLGDAIAAIVGEEFGTTQRVVLLSNLGQNLKKAGVDYQRILDGRRLAEFIRTALSDRVTVVPVPGKDKAFGAHPAGVDLDTKQNPFGSPPIAASNVVATESASDKRPLLNSQVWFAFSHFLADGRIRMLEIQPEPLYRDVPNDAGVPDGAYVIDRELIVPVGSMAKADRDARIYENIERWAKEARVQLDALLARKAERTERRNLLDEVIRALGPADLSRVTLPLDVVKTLRDRRL